MEHPVYWGGGRKFQKVIKEDPFHQEKFSMFSLYTLGSGKVGKFDENNENLQLKDQ